MMPKEAVTLGMAVSLSGRYAPQGRQCVFGLECYAQHANAAGGVLLGERRLPVRLRIYDDESHSARGRQLAERLIDYDHVDILLGPYGSGLSLAAAEIAERRRTVLWNHSGAADTLCDGWSWVVSILTPASQYFRAALELIASVDPTSRRVALVHTETGFANAVAEGTRAWIVRAGYALAHDHSYQSGERDFTPLLSELRAEPPDVVLGVGRIGDELQLARQLVELRPKVKAVVLVAAGIGRFQAELAGHSEGFLAPSQWEPRVRYSVDHGPSAEEFTRNYTQIAPLALDYPAAQACAAGLVAQRCIEEAGSLDPAAVRETAGRLHFTTLYGPYAIDPRTGRQLAHRMLVTQWQGAPKVIVWPPGVAEAPLAYPIRFH